MTRYQIQQGPQNRGGFGRIEKAFDSELERHVAIKVLDPLVTTGSAQDVERFKREARHLASLNHPNIPAIYDVQFATDELRIIFQFIDGQNFREILSESPITVTEAQRWFLQIASALEHAHSKSIVHRDLKPENFLVTGDRQHCYLVDFGIALSVRDKQRVTDPGMILGTPGYMSQEHENGEDPDPRDDIYVLGVCLYEALSGHRIPAGEYAALSSGDEAIPASIDALILDCIKPRALCLKNVAEFSRRLSLIVGSEIPLSELLVRGQLHEILFAISEMPPIEFTRLPRGQQFLILSKAENIIENRAPQLQRARLGFLSVIPKIAIHVDPKRLAGVLRAALLAAYEEPVGDRIGDRSVRQALEVAAETITSNHEVLSKEAVDFVKKQNLADKPNWFYHHLRELLSRLLANPNCSDRDADAVSEALEAVNDEQNKPRESPNWGEIGDAPPPMNRD